MITLVVTQKDIDTSLVNCRDHCMVARSIQRRLKPGYSVKVNSGSFKIHDLDGSDGSARIPSVSLPERVSKLIEKYDVHGKKAVKPFRFSVALPYAEQRRAFN